MAKQRLGKGLNALIPELPQIEDQGVQEIPITDITPNKHQPRQQFDAGKLEQLAGSISKHGIVQPVALRKIDKGYELVAGERRWRAARMAGLKAVPAVVMELDERQMVEIALVENLQREDLNPLEEAEAYRTLLEEYDLTQEEIALAVGKSRPAIANTLRLLNLPPDIQEMVREDRITAGHARAMISLGEKEQKLVADRILKEGLSVRDAEKLVNNMIKERGKKPSRNKDKKPWVTEMEAAIGELLGTRVQIVQNRKKGKIEIEYYGGEDLERILELIKG
jgi:ParB family chromosome partitioning protein